MQDHKGDASCKGNVVSKPKESGRLGRPADAASHAKRASSSSRPGAAARGRERDGRASAARGLRTAARGAIPARCPVLITLRVLDDVPPLRRGLLRARLPGDAAQVRDASRVPGDPLLDRSVLHDTHLAMSLMAIGFAVSGPVPRGRCGAFGPFSPAFGRATRQDPPVRRATGRPATVATRGSGRPAPRV